MPTARHRGNPNLPDKGWFDGVEENTATTFENDEGEQAQRGEDEAHRRPRDKLLYHRASRTEALQT